MCLFADLLRVVRWQRRERWRSAATAWKSIAKVNSVTFVAGGAILFRCGDVFCGQVNLRQSGVTLGSYGSGERPVITGAERLTGWIRHGPYYSTKASAAVRNLFANGVQMTLARYPNSGFLFVGTTNGTTTITSTGINQASHYWDGANIRYRSTDFTFETRSITYGGNTITLATKPDFGIEKSRGFYLDNVLAAMDTAAEWHCDTTTDSVYFWAPGNVDPNTLIVEGSVFDYGINASQSNITVKGLAFTYQAKTALRFTGNCSGIQLVSNQVFGQLLSGIQFDGPSSDCIIDGNTVQQINGVGISLVDATNFRVSNNIVKDVGLVQGYGKSGILGMTGISVGGSGHAISGNIVDSVGYIGIAVYGSNTLVENNLVTNVMLKLDDGGAIYTYFGNAHTIRNNIISNVVGNRDGDIGSDAYKVSNGIYLDGGSYDIAAEGNTVSHVSSSGLFIQYLSYRNIIRDNMFTDCGLNGHGNSIYIVQDTTYSYGQHVITHNVFYTKAPGQKLATLQENNNAMTLHSSGIIDSNYYCNPFGNPVPFGIIRNKGGSWSYDDCTFDEWKSQTRQDSRSQLINFNYYPGVDSLFINNTFQGAQVDLAPHAYRDLDSNLVSGYVSLAPFSSILLFRDTLAKTTTVSEQSQNTPGRFTLLQNYPNPFNPSTEISYHLPADLKVRLEVFDSIGRIVALLVNEPQKAGDHTVAFTIPDLASGIYLYRLSAGGFTQTKKMLLLK